MYKRQEDMRGEEAKQAEQEVEHLAADMKKEIPQPGKTETAQNPQVSFHWFPSCESLTFS